MMNDMLQEIHVPPITSCEQLAGCDRTQDAIVFNVREE